jgi:hypothetical protein
LGAAFLDHLRAEYAAAKARAERAAAEAEQSAKDAEKLAGALEAAERFVLEKFAPTSGDQQEPSPDDALDAHQPLHDFVVTPRTQAVTIVRNENWARRLHGMTQKQALVAIAEFEGGILDVKKARDIFIEAKVTDSKNPRTVYGVIHTILRGSPQFEKADVGTFRLKPPQSPSPGMIGQPLLNEWRNGTE